MWGDVTNSFLKKFLINTCAKFRGRNEHKRKEGRALNLTPI